MTELTERTMANRSGEKMIQANGVELCVETFGERADPAILLVHGASTSMYGWDDAFCEQLAAGERFVIRYDQRDTGRSVSYPPGAPGYSMHDLVADTVGLLDAFELPSAHFVGISMGGGIVMNAALDYPDRVASITLAGTSRGGPDLPPMSDDFLAFIGQSEMPDWSDRDAVVERMLTFIRICAGPHGVIDETAMREALGMDVDRTTNVASSQINHFAINPGAPVGDRLGEISAPALVIHGSDDPLFPVEHGEALAREIEGATLLVLEGAGHLLTPDTWEEVVPAILNHTKSASTSR